MKARNAPPHKQQHTVQLKRIQINRCQRTLANHLHGYYVSNLDWVSIALFMYHHGILFASREKWPLFIRRGIIFCFT